VGLATTTRAIQVRRAGGPEVLETAEIELAPPGDGELQLRHTAIGLNFIDVYFRTGLYPVSRFPYVPGMEAAGIVEALGPNASGFAVGDRVAYATRPLGAYCERRNLASERVVKLPPAVDERVAAAVMLKGMTARTLLCTVFRVERGETILVHAAAGGVGSLLCQWGRHLGATVIGTVSTDAKAERAHADGCTHPIVSAREDFVQRVKELTRGAGVPVVYDSIGRDTVPGSLECLAPRGMLVCFGQSSGPVPPIDIAELARGSKFLTRPGLLDYVTTRRELEECAGEMLELVARGVLGVHVDQVVPLADAQRAHRDLESRRTTGSTVLVP
jgi:NADPH:quinone reductase